MLTEKKRCWKKSRKIKWKLQKCKQLREKVKKNKNILTLNKSFVFS